jgi:hypothetical protein
MGVWALAHLVEIDASGSCRARLPRFGTPNLRWLPGKGRHADAGLTQGADKILELFDHLVASGQSEVDFVRFGDAETADVVQAQSIGFDSLAQSGQKGDVALFGFDPGIDAVNAKLSGEQELIVTGFRVNAHRKTWVGHFSLL